MDTKAQKNTFWVNLGEIVAIYVLTMLGILGFGVTLMMVPVVADMVGSAFGYTIID